MLGYDPGPGRIALWLTGSRLVVVLYTQGKVYKQWDLEWNLRLLEFLRGAPKEGPAPRRPGDPALRRDVSTEHLLADTSQLLHANNMLTPLRTSYKRDGPFATLTTSRKCLRILAPQPRGRQSDAFAAGPGPIGVARDELRVVATARSRFWHDLLVCWRWPKVRRRRRRRRRGRGSRAAGCSTSTARSQSRRGRRCAPCGASRRRRGARSKGCM
eukprot:9467227-Pyramimonas_sp.AAC.1